ncbi:hypothetical protein [Dongshaea marina]|uniref:hypothetical protein n=1 Tax=Dongshaea marina TaxID=2047966 RepID=UPI000D3ED0EB|nr:hypothetical protein [Dongshaea marina]
MGIIDLRCYECMGSGLDHQEMSRCRICKGHGEFDSEYELLQAVIRQAEEKQLVVIERICELVFSRVQQALHTDNGWVKSKSERHQELCDVFFAPSHNQLMMPWDAWEIYALYRGVSGALSRLGAQVMQQCHEHQWQRYANEVGHRSALRMIRRAKRTPKKTAERWQYLLSESWMDQEGQTS